MEALKGLYHADKLDEQTFIDNFTIRLKEYRQIIDNLLQQKKKPLQHFLITGKRGMGKSTLLRRIYIEASSSPLNEKLLAVRLGAEQYRLSRLFKLWEMVIEQLSNNESSLLKQKKELEKSKHYEENLLPIINDYLTKTGKTLLLLIDNFDQFIEKIPVKDQHVLREALMLYPIQIIGNTVFYNEYFKSYDNPFFDFFKPIHLENLDKEEAEEFIKLRAAVQEIDNFEDIFIKQRGKINALRILSGGVPRTLLILLSIVSKRNTGDAVEYLNEMIEQVTPLYQDRMKSLSSQQQEIMHHLAMHWDRTPVKELAAEMRIPSKSISAQLLQLERSGFVKQVDIPGRNRYYEIDERFFNIWLLMSEAAPYDTKRVIWLTKWLDAFYSKDELKDFASFCNSSLKKAKPANRFLVAQALSESENLNDFYKKSLVRETTEELEDKISEVKIWADTYSKKLIDKESMSYSEVLALIDKRDFDNAWHKLNELERTNETLAHFGKGNLFIIKNDFENAEKYFQMASEKGSMEAMYNLGILYKEQKNDIVGAEEYYLRAVKQGHPGAMVNLGLLYVDEKRDVNKAEKYFQMAIERDFVDAVYNLGFLYESEKKDIDGAEKYYQMAAEKGHTVAMFNLGFLYENEKKDMAGAEKYYQMAVERGDANAMFNLALLYQIEKKDTSGAEKYYQMAIEKDHALAMFNLGFLYENEKKDMAGAEKYYQMAVERGDANAMFNLALLYQIKKKDTSGAEKYYQMAVEQGDVSAMFNLGILYETEKKDIVRAEKYYQMAVEKGHAGAMINLGVLYGKVKKDIAGAEEYFRMAAEKEHTRAMYNLGFLYSEEKRDIAGAEKYYQMAAEEGHIGAMFNLGFIYSEQKMDIAGAERYYQMAAEEGHISAMFNLALLYEADKKDIVNAEKYYQMAVKKGDADAMYNLGILYETEKKDIVGAERFYLMAIEKGDADAMYNLGVLYETEKKDIVGAEKFYQMAVEKGDADAMSNLADLYFNSNNFSQKGKAYQLSVGAVEITDSLDLELKAGHIKILLWNEKVKEANQVMTDILKNAQDTDYVTINALRSFQYFLVFRQKQFLYKLFMSNEELIDRYKPIYYALLSEMRDEHLKEYLKMTSELEEPVKAILDFVSKERKRLGI